MIGPLSMNPKVNVQPMSMSSIGSLVRCDYVLRAITDMDMCCQGNPEICLNIMVCNYAQQPMETYLKPFVPPPNYDPVIAPPVVYNLNGPLGPNGVLNTGGYPNYYEQMQAGYMNSGGYSIGGPVNPGQNQNMMNMN